MTPITSQERSALLLAAQGYTDNIAATLRIIVAVAPPGGTHA